MARDHGSPDDWPPEVRAHAEAGAAAFQRIRRDRRRLSQSQAEAIIREEATARGIRRADHVVTHEARQWLRPAWWPLLHPVAARREGYRFTWEQEPD